MYTQSSTTRIVRNFECEKTIVIIHNLCQENDCYYIYRNISLAFIADTIRAIAIASDSYRWGMERVTEWWNLVQLNLGDSAYVRGKEKRQEQEEERGKGEREKGGKRKGEGEWEGEAQVDEEEDKDVGDHHASDGGEADLEGDAVEEEEEEEEGEEREPEEELERALIPAR